MSLQKLVFFAWEAVGQGPYFISVKEKGFSFSKQVPILCEEGGRVGAYFDPLSINLETMDCSSFHFWCLLGLPLPNQGPSIQLVTFSG